MLDRKVLIVEGHEESRKSLASALKKGGFDVFEASSEKTALHAIIENQVDAIISELKLPDGDGLSLLNHLKKNALDRPVIFVTAFATMSSAIQAMKMGAADFLSKPVKVKDITEALASALKKSDHRNDKEISGSLIPTPQSQVAIIAISQPMRQLLSLVQRIAPYDNNILLCGESGSGKEVIAREIHRLGPRSGKPFVPVIDSRISNGYPFYNLLCYGVCDLMAPLSSWKHEDVEP